MAKKRRADLKKAFYKGNVPKDEDFYSLIDSSLNADDDGITREEGKGISIKAEGKNLEVLSFYQKLGDESSGWFITLKSEDQHANPGLSIGKPNSGSLLFIENTGNVGIGMTRPDHKLDVDGMVGMKGRVGYYASSEVPADGKWHDVLSNLNEYQAFEVLATVGTKGAHAVMHAIAVCAYGQSKGAINATCGYFGRSRNKLEMRWSGTYFSYQLQIRSKRNYGPNVLIRYNIAKLFCHTREESADNK